MIPVTPDTRDAVRIALQRYETADAQLRTEQGTLHALIRVLLYTQPFDYGALNHAQLRLAHVNEQRVNIRTLTREAVAALNRSARINNPTDPLEGI